MFLHHSTNYSSIIRSLGFGATNGLLYSLQSGDGHVGIILGAITSILLLLVMNMEMPVLRRSALQ